jgi:hypothetical protein
VVGRRWHPQYALGVRLISVCMCLGVTSGCDIVSAIQRTADAGDRLVTAPTPSVVCLDCEKLKRVAPATPVRLALSWTGVCESSSGMRHTCEPQTFSASFTCGTEPCVTQSFIGNTVATGRFSGFAGLEVRAPDAGELMITAELTNVQTMERSTTTLPTVEVVEPASLGVDCIRVEASDNSTRPCGADELVDHQGVLHGDVVDYDSLRFGAFGETAGQRIALVPDSVQLCIAGSCALKGCAVGAGAEFGGQAVCEISPLIPTEGEVEVRVSRSGLTASRVVMLR